MDTKWMIPGHLMSLTLASNDIRRFDYRIYMNGDLYNSYLENQPCKIVIVITKIITYKMLDL